MEGENSPEYKAIKKNREQFEKQMAPHLPTIAKKLRQNGSLGDDECERIIASACGPSQLVKAMYLAIDVDPVHSFVTYIDAMKTSGNNTFKQFVGRIESARKDKYRELLDLQSDGSKTDFDLFISYAHGEPADSVVCQLETALRDKQFKVFVDRSAIQPGDLWSAEIVSGVRSCKAFIAVLTKRYTKSQYCQGELYEAEVQKKQFFPVVVEKGWDKEVAARPVKEVLQRTQYSFLDTEESKGMNLPLLIRCIEDKLRPAAAEV